jgi:DNA-binding transcriptional MerR regulator
MDSSKGNFLPATQAPSAEQDDKGFSKIAALLDTMGSITLSQVCTVTGLEATTIQNWIKRGWVANPVGKKYEERHIARILIINALKECFRLEQIASLMNYVNNNAKGTSGEAYIKESELYSFLRRSLQMLGQVDDLSRSGVESIVDKVIALYESPNIDAHMRIRKALTVMIYACVCTDVKRGTEAMMKQIIDEYESIDHTADEPEEAPLVKEKTKKATKEVVTADAAPVATPIEPPLQQAPDLPSEPVPEPATEEVEPPVVEARKTIAQALREWEQYNTIEDNADSETINEIVEKSSKTWLSRIGFGSKDVENS